MDEKKSLYAQLMERAKQRSGTTTTAAPTGRFGFQGSANGRFHGVQTTTAATKEQDVPDRPPAQPIQRDGVIVRADDTDRDLAYRPPVVEQGQTVVWKAPTFWQIMSDLGLRIAEVGIASIAQEIAYFFTRRRFLPKHLRRG